MRFAGTTQLIAVSLGIHVALGIGIGAVPPRRHRELIAITMSEAKKPKTPPHATPPPEPEPPAPAAHPVRAKSAPPQPKATAIPPSTNAQNASLDALPDFGLSMSGGGTGGMAVPAGRPATAGPAAGSVAKILTRTAAPRGDDCADPPAKPTSTSHPTPVYPETEIASGVVGKVRVEITVDEHGRVVSARILQGLGAAFDQAALAAARASTFDAAIRCGRPSASTFRISYSFRPPSP